MPKKFTGENSKATAARARKTAAKDAEHAKKQKDLEDAYWKDDDKQNIKKQQRKVIYGETKKKVITLITALFFYRKGRNVKN